MVRHKRDKIAYGKYQMKIIESIATAIVMCLLLTVYFIVTIAECFRSVFYGILSFAAPIMLIVILGIASFVSGDFL